jgi:hypothetical protein
MKITVTIDETELAMVIFGLRCAQTSSDDMFKTHQGERTYTDLLQKISKQYQDFVQQ